MEVDGRQTVNGQRNQRGGLSTHFKWKSIGIKIIIFNSISARIWHKRRKILSCLVWFYITRRYKYSKNIKWWYMSYQKKCHLQNHVVLLKENENRVVLRELKIQGKKKNTKIKRRVQKEKLHKKIILIIKIIKFVKIGR